MWREILGLEKKPNSLVELIVPRRGFNDVVLPDETRQQLYEALTQIEKHHLIFSRWGLGERHPTGLGLAFNFAGPPGTGKTICAEAVAYTLGRKLLRVRYAELESCWAGETGKNIRSVFREARAQDAVLFFDEADSIASRRFSNVQVGYEREANQAVNILLKELEEHEGVVVFATNLASNFDPAFERRIRTHILFRIPNVAERERIWQVQVHPQKTPLAPDVDFRELAQRFEVAGGDIRNAVLKAAQMAAAEQGADEDKVIHQRHLVAAMEQTLKHKEVMQQNAIDPFGSNLLPWQNALGEADERLEALEADVQSCRTELSLLGDSQTGFAGRVEERVQTVDARADEAARKAEAALSTAEGQRGELEALRLELARSAEAQTTVLERWQEDQNTTLQEVLARIQSTEARLAGATVIGFPKPVAAGLGMLLLLLAGLAGHFIR